MAIKKYLIIFLILGSSLSMADDKKDTKKAPAATAEPVPAATPPAAVAVHVESDSDESEGSPITDEWMDHPGTNNKQMWENYFRNKKLKEEEQKRDQKLKEAEHLRDEKEAEAKKAGTARAATGGAGPSED